MNKKLIVLLYFLIAYVAVGQNNLLTEGLKHHFTFDDAANLENPAVGNTLVRGALEGVTQTFKVVSGPANGNGAVEVGLGSFYKLDLDFEANGPDTAKRVNRFTLVIDFYLPQTGVWYGLHAATNDGDPIESDWESFIRDGGNLGVGSTGYSYYKVPEKQWHRLVIASDLGTSYKYYLDGQLAQDGKEQEIDGRFSLPSIDGANQILLFGDNDSEDANIYISELGIYDRTLTLNEVEALGGYGHFIPTENPTGQWGFNNPNNLTEAFSGDSLTLVGTHTAVEGPETTDGAVKIEKGSYYIAKHNILPNGGGQRVNEYSITIDFKIDELGKKYSLLQTDTTNSSDAELIINEQGKLGNSDLGFTDSSVIAGDWYRLVMITDLDSMVKVYLDGDSVLNGGVQTLDGKFSLSPKDISNKVLFFADDNGDDNAISIANLSIYNRVLSKDNIVGLGGYYHGPPNTEVTAARTGVYFNGNKIINKYGIIEKNNDDFNFEDGDFTIEVWAKPDRVYPSDPCILSDKNWDSGSNPGWVISMRGDDWKFNAADDQRNRYDVSGPPINDGNWHHLTVIAKEDSGLKLITDDIETVWAGGDAFKKCGTVNNPDMPICVAQDGTQNYGSAPAPVVVDEIRIWKGVALDPATVKAWRHKKITDQHPNYSALVGYWQFNEGKDSMVADISGKNHDMKLIGNPKWDISYAVIANDTVKALDNINAIWGAKTKGESSGLMVEGAFPFPDASFALAKVAGTEGAESVEESRREDNPYLVFGNNAAENATASGIPTGVEARLSKQWRFDATEVAIKNLSVSFSLSGVGGTGNAGDAANYVLLKSDKINGDFTIVPASVEVDGEMIKFTQAMIGDGVYTLGSKSLSASPLGGLVVGIDDFDNNLPNAFALKQNYPNPFNPTTTINFALPVNANVNISIYNVLGQLVETLINKDMSAGFHNVNWNAGSKNLSSGMYIYSIKASGKNGMQFNKEHKMMLIK